MPTLVTNKKAGLNYELQDRFEAGAELFGHEIKSLRKQLGKLEGAHVVVRGGEAFLVGASIPPYQEKNTPASYDQERTRKLLLSKKEIDQILGIEKQKGLTVVPISWYTKGRYVKLSFAIARGKKKHDKRETIKKKDMQRDVERETKARMR